MTPFESVAFVIAGGWLANIPAFVILRWLVAKPVHRAIPTTCVCGYPRAGLAQGAPCPECGAPAPRFTAPSRRAGPPSHAGVITLVTFMAIGALYGVSAIGLGMYAGILDPVTLAMTSLFVIPAAFAAAAHVLIPNLGSQTLGFRATARLAACIGGITLACAVAFAWHDVLEAAASTTSEWRGIGLLFVCVPAIAGTGWAALIAGIVMLAASPRRPTRA